MSLHALKVGQQVKIETVIFRILRRLSGAQWQLENVGTGEWHAFQESDLLDRFCRNELSFIMTADEQTPLTNEASVKPNRVLAHYAPSLIEAARVRLEYLKEIDRRQPISITQATIAPLARAVANQIQDPKPPSWRTICRDYRKWVTSGRDIHAIIPRYADRGGGGSRMLPEVKSISDLVIQDLYMTAERKRVPEVYLELVRRLRDTNKFRPESEQLPIPHRSTLYRQIGRKPRYEVMAARYGKRRAEMEFRVSGKGPETFQPLQRVSMDHTLSDLVVVDDRTMLPLGRPTITSALDEHTRCPMGFYTGFEPPSCLSVMRGLKHAILPKTYVPMEFPSIRNSWDCYGVPELLVVDNPPEFHSSHFEHACLQIGTDIQYAKVLVPWYKGKLERFQGTMNHDLAHGNPGTTFSNILERDDYDPAKHAVVLLSTFREMLHKWIIDVYLQTPHRGIKDTPAHRWHSELSALPPPLPPSASALDVALGMTAQRVVFHYGIELEGLKYNSEQLGALRQRIGNGAKIELTFDPGDLGHINVLDSQNGEYIRVPAVGQGYASKLSLWQHKIIRRYAQRQLNARLDLGALAQAKAEIRALVERDFNRKSTHGRKRHTRFLHDHSSDAATSVQPSLSVNLHALEARRQPGEPRLLPEAASPPEAFADDELLPVFETTLDLPQCSAVEGK
jgi:putative transposase